MKDNFEYLSYYQVMSLMYAIDQIRKSNQYFSSGISEEFEEYVVKRASEIAMCSPIKLKLNPKAKNTLFQRV